MHASLLQNTSWSIHNPAIPSDLPTGPSEGTNIAQLHHGSSKVPKECSIVATVGPHKGILRPTIEENLVGVEKAAAVNEVGEVIVVEAVGGEGVERGQVGVPTGGRAIGFSGGGEVGVYVGFVVYAVPEELALCLAYCVASREHG